MITQFNFLELKLKHAFGEFFTIFILFEFFHLIGVEKRVHLLNKFLIFLIIELLVQLSIRFCIGLPLVLH